MPSQRMTMSSSSYLPNAVKGFWELLCIPFQAWAISERTAEETIKTKDSQEVAEKADKWRMQKQEELKYVGITSALIAGTVSASFSWSNVERAPTVTLASWYSALLMILISITTATQQHNTLQKIKSLDHGANTLQRLLRRDSMDKTPAVVQHYIWQTPIMLLNFGILLYVLGLLALVFNEPLLGETRTQSVVAIKVVFGIAVAFTFGSYITAWLGVYSKLRSIDKRQASKPSQV